MIRFRDTESEEDFDLESVLLDTTVRHKNTIIVHPLNISHPHSSPQLIC